MDAKTLEWLEKHHDVDMAVSALVRLAQDAIERDGHGDTGVELICKGRSEPIKYREKVHLVFK